MSLDGISVYDSEIMGLMRDLQAKGILLIVVEGNRNKADVEFGSALLPEVLDKVVGMLESVLDEIKRDRDSLDRGS